MNPIYMADWYDNRWGDMVGLSAIIRDFNISSKEEKKMGNIVFAYYNFEDGYAYVLLEKNGRHYQVEAKHKEDRYDGIRGQWKPEYIDLLDLGVRLFKHELGFTGTGRHKFNNELTKIILNIKGI